MSSVLKNQCDRLVSHFGLADAREIGAFLESMRLPYAQNLPFHFRQMRGGLSLLFLNPYGVNIRIMPDDERQQKSHPFIAKPVFRYDLHHCSIGIFGNLLSRNAVSKAKANDDDHCLEATLRGDGFDPHEAGDSIGYLNILNRFDKPELEIFEGYFPLVFDHNAYIFDGHKRRSVDCISLEIIDGVQDEVYAPFAEAFAEAFNQKSGRFDWVGLAHAFRLCAYNAQTSPMMRVLNSMSSHRKDYPRIVEHAAAYGDEMQAHVQMVLAQD